MEFRVNLTVEVDQVGRSLAVKHALPFQLVYQAGQWRAQCQSPPVATLMYDTIEEALIAGAKEAAAELRAEPVATPAG